MGSFLNTANNWALTKEKWYKVIKEIQDINNSENELSIPIIYGVDQIHGATYTAGATMFPQQIGQAASRNAALVEQGAAITAYETRASDICAFHQYWILNGSEVFKNVGIFWRGSLSNFRSWYSYGRWL